MENIVIEGTFYTPRVEFYADGRLLIEGRSLPEDVSILYTPLIEWVMGLKAESVVFNINLEYFNSASSKKIMELLKHLDANINIKTLQINWHYEEGDDDSVDTAEIFEESLLKANFRYLEYEEAA